MKRTAHANRAGLRKGVVEEAEEEGDEGEESEEEGSEEEEKGQANYRGRLEIAQNAVVKNKARETKGGHLDSKFCTECGVVSSRAHPL
jgi:hypothetical protein